MILQKAGVSTGTIADDEHVFADDVFTTPLSLVA